MSIPLKKILKRRWAWGSMILWRAAAAVLSPFFRIRRNKVVFSTFDGKGFGDNSKYIALELIRRNSQLELVWLMKKEEQSDLPPEIRRVDNSWFSELYHLMTAGVWVDTHFKRHIFKKGLFKRRGQLYLQTWHGSLGIKNIPTVEELAPSLYYPMLADIRSVDHLISNSIYEDIKFRECFSTDKIQPGILKLGHPRNDIFFQDNSLLSCKIKQQYGLTEDCRIFTYMPTFRKKRDLAAYTLDFERVLEALSRRFGGKWVIFMRLHPALAGKAADAFRGIAGVVDVSSHPDSQELQIVSDILCTDYSSCIYDFILSRRAGFIFASDLQDYNTVRGLRYPLTETPFMIAENNDALVENILAFDDGGYQKNLDKFLEFHGCVDDGKASARVGDVIEEFVFGKRQGRTV